MYDIYVAELYLKAMTYGIVMSGNNLLFIINHIFCQVLQMSKAYKLNVNKLFSKYCVYITLEYNSRFRTKN